MRIPHIDKIRQKLVHFTFDSNSSNAYNSFISKRNWYQSNTHIRGIGTNSPHPTKQVTGATSTSRFFTRQKLSTNYSHVLGTGTNSAHVRNYQHEKFKHKF